MFTSPCAEIRAWCLAILGGAQNCATTQPPPPRPRLGLACDRMATWRIIQGGLVGAEAVELLEAGQQRVEDGAPIPGKGGVRARTFRNYPFPRPGVRGTCWLGEGGIGCEKSRSIGPRDQEKIGGCLSASCGAGPFPLPPPSEGGGKGVPSEERP